MVYDPALGYDPVDPTGSASGRSLLARQGANTLGSGMQTSAQTAAANATANEYARQFDLSYQLSKQKLDNEYQAAVRTAQTAQEKNRIDAAYNQAQIQLAQQRLAQDQTQFVIAQSGLMPDGSPTLSLQQLQAQNAATEGQLTGVYKNQPTLANLAQTAQYTGLYGNTPTLQAINQEQQYGLNLAGLSGQLPNGGGPTLAATGQEQNYGLNLAGVTGYGPNGAPTLANTQFQTGATGYLNGAPTLSREQAAANTSLQAAQLGASLQGPGNWAKFLQAQYGVANSPASSLVSSVPGGLGAPAAANPPPMTLGTVLNGFGVMPQAGPGPGVANGQQVYAGGSSSFNESTGQYVPGQQGYTPQQQQQWAAQTMAQPWWQQQNANNPYAQQGGGGSPWYTTGGGSQQSGAAGRSADGADVLSGGRVTANEGGSGQPAFLQGYNPYSLTGAVGQVANAPRLTAQDFGMSDQEANTVKGYLDNPGSAPMGWWESKSQPQRDFLGSFNTYGGGDQATFLSRYRDSRPRQGAYNAA